MPGKNIKVTLHHEKFIQAIPCSIILALNMHLRTGTWLPLIGCRVISNDYVINYPPLSGYLLITNTKPPQNGYTQGLLTDTTTDGDHCLN